MTRPRAISNFAVNSPLTRRSPRPVTENPAYAAFITRILRAYSRRIATGDIEALADMAALAAQLDSTLREAVTSLRACGYSWADIARPLGVTRQAAQQRWGNSRQPAA
jgi:DNA-directed RNA polymerase specialized sigma24 family protein